MTTETMANAPRTPVTQAFFGGVGRWIRVIPVKNRWSMLILRGFVGSALITVLGALFTALGPVPLELTPEKTPVPADAHFILLGYLVFGQVLVIVSGIWIHLRDVIGKEIGMNYTAMSNRASVVAGAGIFAGVSAAIFAAVCFLLGVSTYCLVAGADLLGNLGTPHIFQLGAGLTISAGLLTAIATSVAFIIRNPIASVIVIVFWITVGEDTLGSIPGIGPVIKMIGPMSNSYVLSGVAPGPAISGSPALCGLWLLLFTVVFGVVAAVVEQRRRGWVEA